MNWMVHIVGVVHSSGGASGFNYILSTGEISNLPYVHYKQSDAKEVRIPDGAVIRKVIMWTTDENNTSLWGI